MKINREAKIGIASIIILFILYWGVNFIKGSNVLTSTNIFTAKYANVDGLEMSSPVVINGMKVGSVVRVSMTDVNKDIEVDFIVDGKYKIPSNSTAELGSQSLMGGKQIVIHVGDAKTYLSNKDVIKSTVDTGLADAVAEMTDRAARLVDSLTVTLSKANTLMSEQMILDAQSTVANLNSATGSMGDILASEKVKIAEITRNLSALTAELNGMMPDVKGTLSNMNSLTDSLNMSLPAMLTEIDAIIAKLSAEDGTIAKLLNDSELYDNASITLDQAAKLLEDLREDPKRYVHFSLFGKNKDNRKDNSKIK